MNITTKMNNEELTNIGRAMERSGHTNLADFIRWAVLNQTNETLKKSTT